MSKKPYRDHEEATIESFQNDPRFATEYLNAVLEDGDACPKGRRGLRHCLIGSRRTGIGQAG